MNRPSASRSIVTMYRSFMATACQKMKARTIFAWRDTGLLRIRLTMRSSQDLREVSLLLDLGELEGVELSICIAEFILSP
jgi:hypothetical protein